MLLLTGIVSYNYTNTSYAKWSSSIESKNTIKVYVKAEKSASEFVQDNVGIGGLEEITHEIDDTLQVDSKFATEYRYRGGNVNNYVTFNNETWRIIGIIPTEDTDGNVENRFKIIRDESIGQNYWNSGVINIWKNASLNGYLNNSNTTSYYTTISDIAKNMIGSTKYYYGGYTSTDISTETMWQCERKRENKIGSTYFYSTTGENAGNISGITNLAIMYASDYGYAASKECTNNLGKYSNSNLCKTINNWLDKQLNEWLFTPSSFNETSAFSVGSSSTIYNASSVKTKYEVRPVVTLLSSVKISGGSGTSSDPYTLSVN